MIQMEKYAILVPLDFRCCGMLRRNHALPMGKRTGPLLSLFDK